MTHRQVSRYEWSRREVLKAGCRGSGCNGRAGSIERPGRAIAHRRKWRDRSLSDSLAR